ncbi:hypothetical protein LIA77_10249 [Sarocladium implicatum]|nr:hypothetical protein LIA77_10249 [Sarocladium implicatum]
MLVHCQCEGAIVHDPWTRQDRARLVQLAAEACVQASSTALGSVKLLHLSSTISIMIGKIWASTFQAAGHQSAGVECLTEMPIFHESSILYLFHVASGGRAPLIP